MMDNEKQFRCSHGRARATFTRELESAVELGWDDYAAGRIILDLLEVGQTAVDQDGDSWERIE
jgi:hypothetical protein